jgi:hypothetical protein
MSTAEARDVVVVLAAVELAAAYVISHGNYLYPATALAFALVWEAIGWEGFRSLAVLGIVGIILIVAAFVLRSTGRPLIDTEHASSPRTIMVATALLAAAFIVGGC